MDLLRSVSMTALAAGAVLAIGHASPATAAPFEFIVSNFTGDSVFSVPLSFARFNPSLGTLTGVVFTLANERANATASVEGNFFGGEGGFASGSVLATFETIGPGSLALHSGNATADATCVTPSSGCNATGIPAVADFSPSGLIRTVTTGLTPFIYDGVNSFFDVFVAISLDTETVFDCYTFGGGDCFVRTRGSARWLAELTVEFRFDPTGGSGGGPDAVPEPATLGLLGAGLAALAAARRRRG